MYDALANRFTRSASAGHKHGTSGDVVLLFSLTTTIQTMSQYAPDTYIANPTPVFSCEVVVNRITQLRLQSFECWKPCWTAKNIIF